MTTIDRLATRPPVLATGVGVQLMLLAAVSAGWGLGPVGWFAGLTYTAVGYALLVGAAQRSTLAWGPADQVTLARATLTGCITALVADALAGASTPVALLVTVGSVALVLDAVDGAVARRTGTSSPLGARFDMEVDAFLILVLAVFVSLQLGPWVLAIGGMRYAFVAATWAFPWLRADLPSSRTRKVVAAWQGVTLVVVASDLFPTWLTVAGVGLSLGLLTLSFGRDIAWLSVQQRTRGQQYL